MNMKFTCDQTPSNKSKKHILVTGKALQQSENGRMLIKPMNNLGRLQCDGEVRQLARWRKGGLGSISPVSTSQAAGDENRVTLCIAEGN
jgi:hypothetical protein